MKDKCMLLPTNLNANKKRKKKDAHHCKNARQRREFKHAMRRSHKMQENKRDNDNRPRGSQSKSTDIKSN